jgi:hypothetical protein
MKRFYLQFFTLILITTFAIAQKGINVAVQFNTQRNIYKDALISEKDLGTGIGLGVNFNKKVFKLPFVFEPRVMFNSQRTSSSSTIKNIKTTYIQIPISFRLFSKKTYFDNEISNQETMDFSFGTMVIGGSSPTQTGGTTGFAFTLDAGMYLGVAVGGKYNGSTKLKYGEGATDNRAKLDYGFTTTFSFGPAFSSFRGYIQVQRGFNNVIPNARIVNNATRKINALNVGLCFKVKTGKGKK